MESNGNTSSSILDNLSKLVSCFGIILGVAYIFGLARSYFLFSAIKAPWVIGVMNPQTLISDGLPSALALVLVTASVYIIFPTIDKLGFAANVIIPIVAFAIVVIIVAFKPREDSDLLLSVMRLLPTLAGSICFVWAFRMYVDGHSGNIIGSTFLMGSLISFLLIPYLQYDSAGRGLKWAEKGTPLVVNEKNEVQGVLVGIFQEKYVILSCREISKISFSDITTSLHIQPAESKCSTAPTSDAEKKAP